MCRSARERCRGTRGRHDLDRHQRGAADATPALGITCWRNDPLSRWRSPGEWGPFLGVMWLERAAACTDRA